MADALLGGLLGKVYSQSDVAKRKLRDLLSNPVESLQQIVGNANDRAGLLNKMTYAAANEGIGYGPETQKLAGLLAESYNPVGMFIGAGSKAFDKSMAFTATKLEKKGLSPQEIWKETGTVRGPDGQWRQEISDKESFVKGTKPFEDVIMGAYDRGVLKTGNQLYKTTVEDVMYHNPLKEAYPELMGTETRMLRKGSDARGSLRKDVMNKQQVLEVRKDLPPEDARSTMLHELQHGIQESEGFAAGGNAETMDRLIGKAKERDFLIKQSDEWKSANDLVNNVYDKYFAGQLNLNELKVAEKELQKQYPILREQITASDTARKIGDDPVDAYKRLMGEAEARLTQTRRNLSPEERKQYFPFEYMDLEKNPYGLDVWPHELLNLDTKGNLIEKGLLGQ
jgi:hypothetical protein